MTLLLTNQKVLLRKKLLLSVLSKANVVNGRKKLQKMIYLTNVLGWDVFNDFRFHLYGPYSDHLYYEIQNLIEAKMIEEVKTGESYSYSITEKGKSLLEILNSKKNNLEDKTNNLVGKLDSYSSEDLEIMASLFYISNEFNEISYDEMVEELIERKPYLDKDKVWQSLEIFDIINTFS